MTYLWTFLGALIGGFGGSLANYGIKAYLEWRKKAAFIKTLEQKIKEGQGRGPMPILLDLQRGPQGEQLDGDSGAGDVEQ